jgi:translation initiation factor 5A
LVSADDLKKGMFILQNKEIYNILRKEVVVCGTHSHSKTKIFARPLLGGGERNFLFAHKDKVEVPDVENRIGQVIAIGDGALTVMDTRSYDTLDIEANADLISNAIEGEKVFFFTYQGKSVGLKMCND